MPTFSDLGLTPPLLAAVTDFGYEAPTHVLPVYGGQAMHQQIKRLRAGVHVVVGTPGRVMDHLRGGTLTLDAIRIVVLDEADEMLNMGFLEDVE